jgi:hypothetical protein
MPTDRTPDPEDPPDDLVDVPFDVEPDAERPWLGDGLPEIWLGPDLRRVGDESLAALARRGEVFCRAGALVDVVRSDDGAPVIHSLTTAALRERLSAVASYMVAREDEPKRAPPPKEVAEALRDRGEWGGIPLLRGVVDYPVFAPSGRIVAKPGYDSETRLWVADTIRVPKLGDVNDPAVVRAAVADLVEPYCDYHFDDETGGVSVVVSAIMSVVARPAIQGPVPGHTFDGSTPGTGKGLLVTTIGLIATGHAPAIMAYTPRPEEQEKRVIGILESGYALCVLDDIKYALGGPVMDPLLTAWPSFRGRRLGTNEIITVPATTIWIATAVNLEIDDHTVRRVISARVETDREVPEERNDWRHDPLLVYVDEGRHRLGDAVLTILAAFDAAGRPRQKLGRMGSYDAWDALVRHAIVWAGLPDPAQGRDKVRSASPDRIAIAKLLGDDGLPRLIQARSIEKDGARGVTSAMITDAIAEKFPAAKGTAEAFRELRVKLDDRDKATHAIGRALGKLKGRHVGCRQLVAVSDRGGLIWCVRESGPAGEPQPPDREVL